MEGLRKEEERWVVSFALVVERKVVEVVVVEEEEDGACGYRSFEEAVAAAVEIAIG